MKWPKKHFNYLFRVFFFCHPSYSLLQVIRSLSFKFVCTEEPYIKASSSFLELSHFFFCSFSFIPGRLDHQEGFQDVVKTLIFGKQSEAVLHGTTVASLGMPSCFCHVETWIASAEGCCAVADGWVPCPFPGNCMGIVQCSWAQTFEAGVDLTAKV